jgi:hypothetical protein
MPTAVRTAHAVRADDVRRPEGPGLAARSDGLDRHAVRVLAQAGHFRLVPEVHPRFDRPPLKDLLHLVLRGDEDVPEPGGQGAQVDGEVAEEAEAVEGAADGLQLVGETAGVELFEGTGVHGERAGEVADLVGTLFEEGDGDSGGGEVTGEEEAGGAGADDDDRARGGGAVVASGAVHGGLLGVNACSPTTVGQRLLANSVETARRSSQRLLANIR